MGSVSLDTNWGEALPLPNLYSLSYCYSMATTLETYRLVSVWTFLQRTAPARKPGAAPGSRMPKTGRPRTVASARIDVSMAAGVVPVMVESVMAAPTVPD